MLQTLFQEYVEKWFKGIVGSVTERFNGKKNEETMLHKTMLTEEYSADMTWESTDINHNIVAADVVAMDSTLPLKKRGVLATASGKLPKLGIKFRKGEKEISDINIMIARGAEEGIVANKIFDDTPKAIKGIDVRKEIMFEEGFSTGTTIVEGDTNDGTGIRVDYGYREDNTFHATTAVWGNASATPIEDLQQMFDKANADGNSIGHMWMSKKSFNVIRNSTEGKELAARYLNVLFTDSTSLPTPNRNTMLEALNDEFGATFHVVDNSYRIQKKDGSYINVKPFAEDNIVATATENVGRLVYGTLVEETNPVNGVVYEKSGSHILVSKFSENEPFAEFTTAQAICLPVIDGVEGIYILHTDATSTSLSLSKSTLVLPVDGGSDVVDIHYDGALSDLTLTWTTGGVYTAKRRGDKITVTAASTHESTSDTLTVSDGTSSATLSISQTVI